MYGKNIDNLKSMFIHKFATGRKEDIEIIDMMLCRGNLVGLERLVENNQNGVVMTKREKELPYRILQLISSIMEQDKKDSSTKVIVYSQNQFIKSFINQLDIDKLKINGINIVLATERNDFELEIKAASSVNQLRIAKLDKIVSSLSTSEHQELIDLILLDKRDEVSEYLMNLKPNEAYVINNLLAEMLFFEKTVNNVFAVATAETISRGFNGADMAKYDTIISNGHPKRTSHLIFTASGKGSDDAQALARGINPANNVVYQTVSTPNADPYCNYRTMSLSQSAAREFAQEKEEYANELGQLLSKASVNPLDFNKQARTMAIEFESYLDDANLDDAYLTYLSSRAKGKVEFNSAMLNGRGLTEKSHKQSDSKEFDADSISAIGKMMLEQVHTKNVQDIENNTALDFAL